MKRKIILALVLVICLTTVVTTALAYSYTYTMTPYAFKEKLLVGSSFNPDSNGRIRINIEAKTYLKATSSIPKTDLPQTFKVVPVNHDGKDVNYYSLGSATSWSQTVAMQAFGIGNAYTMRLHNYTKTRYIKGTGNVNYG